MKFENERLIKDVEAWLDANRPTLYGPNQSVVVRPIFQILNDHNDDAFIDYDGARQYRPCWSSPQIACWHGTEDHPLPAHIKPEWAYHDPIETRHE